MFLKKKKLRVVNTPNFKLLLVPVKSLLIPPPPPLWLFPSPKQQAWATDDVAQIYDKCITELEQHLHAIPPTLAMNPQAQALRSLLEVVVLSRNSRDAIAALGLLQKVSVLNLFVLEDAKFVNIW